MNLALIQDTPSRMKLTVEDYFILHESGALADRGRTELVDGEIYQMNSQFRRHAYVKMRLYDRMSAVLRQIGSPLTALVEATTTLPPHDAPAPDITLTDEPLGPRAIPLGSIALIVEVSDSTLARDLGPKLRLYARNGVPEYWVADCRNACIHQFWSVGPEGYAERREIAFGGTLTAATLPALAIDTDLLA